MVLSSLILILASVALPVSGCVVQRSLSNNLADVYSFGLGSALCFGGLLSLTLGLSTSQGALCTGILFTVLMTFLQRISYQNLITLGMVLGTAIGAFTTITATNVSPDLLQAYYVWSSTAIPNHITTPDLLVCLAAFVNGLFWCYSKPSLASATLLTTSVIFLTGPIWTISIVCPNLARLCTKSHVTLLSIAFGFIILSVSWLLCTFCTWCYLPLSSVISLITVPLYLCSSLHSSRVAS